MIDATRHRSAVSLLLAADAGREARPPRPPPADGAGGRRQRRASRRPRRRPSPATIDVAKLRAEYDKLRDALFRARARASWSKKGVYASKLGAKIRWKGAPDFILRRAEVRLDGNSIWDSGEKPLVDELISVSRAPDQAGHRTA